MGNLCKPQDIRLILTSLHSKLAYHKSSKENYLISHFWHFLFQEAHSFWELKENCKLPGTDIRAYSCAKIQAIVFLILQSLGYSLVYLGQFIQSHTVGSIECKQKIWWAIKFVILLKIQMYMYMWDICTYCRDLSPNSLNCQTLSRCRKKANQISRIKLRSFKINFLLKTV